MNIASTFSGAHLTSVQMDHRKSLGFIRTSWISWFLRVGLVGLAVLARVTSQDKVEAPSSNLFCISECGTCPVICSPPPPLLTYSPPPSPAVPHSPPPEVPHAPPPFDVTYQPPLPKSRALPPLPPPPPPPTHSSRAAPPPPSKPFNAPAPPSGSAQPTVISGPHEYSYPYYYYYASDASSLSTHALFSLLLMFVHRILFCQ